jgi:hypothetical protein
VTNFTEGADLNLYLNNTGLVKTISHVTDSSYTFEGVVPDSNQYYVTQTLGTHESANSSFINPSLRTPTLTAGNGYLEVNNIYPGAAISFYQADGTYVSDKFAEVSSGVYHFTGLMAGDWYYVVQSINGVNSNASSLSAIGIELPQAPSVTAGEEQIAVTGFTSGATLKLYLTDGSLVKTVTAVTDTSYTFTKVEPNNLQYYVTQTVEGLESLNSNFVNSILRVPTLSAGTEYADAGNIYLGATISLYTINGTFVSDTPTEVNVGVYRFSGLSKGSQYYIVQSINGSISIGSNIVTIQYETPAAPTNPVQDDDNDTIGWTYVSGYTNAGDYEYSLDGGTNWYTVTSNPQKIPNQTYAAGSILIRVKADSTIGRPAGISLSSTSTFTTKKHNGNTSTVGTIRQAEVAADSGSGSSVIANIDIHRVVENNKKVDTVTIDSTKMKEVLEQASAANQNNFQVVISDLEDDPADEVLFTLQKEALAQLSHTDNSFELKIGEVTIQLSKDEIAALSEKSEDLYFRLVPLRDSEKIKNAVDTATNSATLKLITGDNNIDVFGTPMTVETNYTNINTKVTFSLDGITLPKDAKLRAAFLNNLAVFIEHSDNNTEIQRGTIIYDTNKKPVGIMIDITRFSTFTIIGFDNIAPKALKLSISGKAKPGKKLTASYKYYDFDSDKEGTTVYNWYRADNAAGKNKKLITGENSLNYTVKKEDSGKYLILTVIPVATTGTVKGEVVSVKVKVAAVNTAPKITKITLTGALTVGSKLTGNYIYSDVEKDKEGESIYKWYRADNAMGKNKVLIGKDNLNYTLTNKDIGKYILFEVNPVAKAGTLTGKAAITSTKSVVQFYKANLKLGLIGSKTYAYKIADVIKEDYEVMNVVIQREGKYYRVTADFVDKETAQKAAEEMKADKLIINYYVSSL